MCLDKGFRLFVSPETLISEAQLADCIVFVRETSVPLVGYYHYALYAGEGEVIHFAASINKESEQCCGDGSGAYGSLINEKKDAEIRKDKITDIWLRAQMRLYDCDGSCDREAQLTEAKKWLGKNRGDYNLLFKNCEHWLRYIKQGHHRSVQVETGVNAVTKAGAAGYAAYKTYYRTRKDRKAGFIQNVKNALENVEQLAQTGMQLAGTAQSSPSPDL